MDRRTLRVVYEEVSALQRPPKTLTPSQNASISVQIPDRSASQQNLYEEDHLRLPLSTGSIIVTTAVESLRDEIMKYLELGKLRTSPIEGAEP